VISASWLIRSCSEYFEGTCIEPSKQWGMEYVELLRRLIGGLRDPQAGRAEVGNGDDQSLTRI